MSAKDRIAIAAFVNERLDERERVAKAAQAGPWMTGRAAEHLVDEVVYGQSTTWSGHITQVCNVEYSDGGQPNAEHIALNDPKSTLREVEAMRRIVDWCGDVIGDRDLSRYDEFGSLADDRNALAVTLAVETLRSFAAIDIEHPDYRQEWQP